MLTSTEHSCQLIKFPGINDNQRIIFKKKKHPTVLSQKIKPQNSRFYLFRKKNTCLRQIISVFFALQTCIGKEPTIFFLEHWCLLRNMKEKKIYIEVISLCLKMNFWLLFPKSFLIPWNLKPSGFLKCCAGTGYLSPTLKKMG